MLAQATADDVDHILIPDKYKAAVAAANTQHGGLFEQLGDLVVHLFAKDGAGAQHQLLEVRVLCAGFGQQQLHFTLVLGVGELRVAA